MNRPHPHPLAFPALLLGNLALAFGPWLVRLSDVGAVATGFWRLAIALPFLWLMARGTQKGALWPKRALVVALAIAAIFYALDLAAWNAGIRMTKLANATLFGNSGSFVLAAWGLWLARKPPSPLQAIALLMAAGGALLLMGGSYELSPRNARGDLLAFAAGFMYGGYLILVERARNQLRPLPTLFIATAIATPFLLLMSLAAGEQIWPNDWTPLLLFAFSSQIVGQGLLVYSLGVFPPLVVGLALLTQPAISAAIGWLAYGETLSATDWIGAAAVAVALVLVRLPKRGLPPDAMQPS